MHVLDDREALQDSPAPDGAALTQPGRPEASRETEGPAAGACLHSRDAVIPAGAQLEAEEDDADEGNFFLANQACARADAVVADHPIPREASEVPGWAGRAVGASFKKTQAPSALRAVCVHVLNAFSRQWNAEVRGAFEWMFHPDSPMMDCSPRDQVPALVPE